MWSAYCDRHASMDTNDNYDSMNLPLGSAWAMICIFLQCYHCFAFFNGRLQSGTSSSSSDSFNEAKSANDVPIYIYGNLSLNHCIAHVGMHCTCHYANRKGKLSNCFQASSRQSACLASAISSPASWFPMWLCSVGIFSMSSRHLSNHSAAAYALPSVRWMARICHLEHFFHLGRTPT